MPPPTWAWSGFRYQPGDAWHVPWALSHSGTALAYLFARQLVAGDARPDGSSNKVLWVTRDHPGGLRIEAHPAGDAEPVITIQGAITYANQMPSEVDLPTPGCWSFDLSWGQAFSNTDGLSLLVLPAGTVPATP
ncbi:MAG: hypothetical protein JF922_24345 [Candidatus Dormibacteraeota bacterium]|uniref:Uncharacterized protein n=1 Tax=Candidatus Nephthysia bennettiae TaxID=3127016 RepID=A0A934N5B7_9BACT|nr:hypothetical protein [Candidatus Dormibacteraeota bacterium]MBJ7607703.1 hypothetical protein [Candidatus Dormibacteraeota bacterium]